MEHLIKIRPSSFRRADGTRIAVVSNIDENIEYEYGLEMPHIINMGRGRMTMIFPSSTAVDAGDMLTDEDHHSVMITDILERRKARGDWWGNPFDASPDFIEVAYL